MLNHQGWTLFRQKLSSRTVLLAALCSLLLLGCGTAQEPGNDSAFVPVAPDGKLATEIPCEQHSDPRLLTMSNAGIRQTSILGLAAGRYALPATAAPTQLVIMFHGHGNDSCAWRKHLQSVTAKGAVAVAMDYTGQVQTPIENYGWVVRAGAADSIAAARYFMARYPSITQVFAFGVSMGGNVSGVAVASPDAKRADDTPLFDHWVVMEGVHDLIEEYTILRGVAPAIADAAIAVQEIEAENGGSLEQVPERYAEITNTTRAADMAYLKSVVLVHAIDDGLVPTVQSREMLLALSAMGVPSHLYTVGGTGGAESGGTASSLLLGPVFTGAGQSYDSPLAGHGWEGSDTQLVMKTGLEQLYALMAGGSVTSGETPVPGI